MPGNPSDSVTRADNRRKSAKSSCPRILAFWPLRPNTTANRQLNSLKSMEGGHRGSTKTKNQKQAERVEARKRVAAEEGESLRPKRVPLVREFAKQFLEWLDKTTLAENTKADYKNGRRLILKTPLSGMRMAQITADDVGTTKFHESPHSRNCAIRTLRLMLGKARDWKVLREVPRIKTVKVFLRDRMVTVEDEKRLLAACKRPLKDVLTIMLDSGLRNGEVIRMRWKTINWEAHFISTPAERGVKLAGPCR
jgi:integrase